MSVSMAPNAARGEAVVRLAGAERRLCLTLGALAEIEGEASFALSLASAGEITFTAVLA